MEERLLFQTALDKAAKDEPIPEHCRDAMFKELLIILLGEVGGSYTITQQMLERYKAHMKLADDSGINLAPCGDHYHMTVVFERRAGSVKGMN
jgi:hypothetical protein